MSEESKALKLYVWENVLRDYSAGLAVVLAHNMEEAIEIMKRDIDKDYIIEQLPFSKVKVVIEPAAFYVYGGG